LDANASMTAQKYVKVEKEQMVTKNRSNKDATSNTYGVANIIPARSQQVG
jgi:hypothetical protein